MDFGKELIKYMELLNCTTSDLSKETGLSYSLLNRYINNKRTPKVDSIYFEKVVNGIYKISLNSNFNLSKKDIFKNLKNAISANSLNIDFDIFVDNFNILQNKLNITNVDLSKAVGYDSSFISRLKNKERKPTDFNSFLNKLGNYIFTLCKNNSEKNIISNLLNCTLEEIQNRNQFQELLENWLSSKHSENQANSVLNFLSKLDTFNLNDYVGTDFSKIKVPTTPIIFKNSKTFFGINGRKQAEGEFLKTTLLSKSDEPIFFYSDLPMSEAGTDEEFKKKWVLAMTMLLKRGLHLNMVHNLNRPINEMFLGLENWIPIYMTGSITPYYFKNPPSNFFLTSHCTSGSIALFSECIRSNEKLSRFYLTTKKNEVNFAKEKSKFLISKATPLMKIYKEFNKDEFNQFMKLEENKNLKIIEKEIFKNIDFCINDGKWIMINKKTSPEIHFVIYHEKLIDAITKFLKE